MNNSAISWLIRLLKGIFIGAGFIVPGMSGGALMAVLGLYEQAITFIANITKDFRQNFFFFLPVGLGGVAGIFIFSVFLSFFFEVAEVQLIWFFIGCIVGTLPTLWAQAGSKGRKSSHLAILVLSFLIAFSFLNYISHTVGGSLPLNTLTWVMTGGLMGLSSIIPGLSTSNLLLFLQLYAPMTQGIANLDFGVIIPIGIGGVASVLVFSRFMVFLFTRAYSALFHAILGFVIASTILIVPFDYDYFSLNGLLSAGTAILGIFMGAWMCSLENKKPTKSSR